MEKTNKFNGPTLLEKFYIEKNGFLAFEGSFRVLPISESFSRGFYSWNEFLAKELNLKDMLFFADNILGEGFCIYKDLFYKYDFESGDLELMGSNLEDFSSTLLSDYNYYTAYSIAKEWQEKNSEILFDEVLLPKLPFVLGGDYSINNLYLCNVRRMIILKSKILDSIKKHNDGDKIKFIYK
ncbi:hypothetical protein [Rodentibacter pneumotropicus]|uniref:Uncharacterized protein n=1 Tax=Rodentibacter pneumotropicus TaxID=758 RepID=A0A3S4Y2V6_9PAST|nr:hypothetical protein [Rodentibacter pneumotropicus]NBH74968.1 hypothetical protein [Rodentibacter pneumotropicus]THA07804.1 hypothetical protein D3M73_01650 [Rodentibacter pneumotropicus]THA09703.1 hypothetical protein D3M81_11180 [Rodentibacter pneumotropicus]VEH67544.1 Uncharacterised protein [Rodentibacter pneumotropicus]